MQRIVVVGPPCSGKTTAARFIAARLGLPHVELDELWWDPNWTEAGPVVFSRGLAAGATGPAWVVDGNYFAVGATEVLLPRCDTVVWLDFARRITARRALVRTIQRAVRRSELWAGNREPVRYALRPIWLLRTALRLHPR
ncbi:MAG: hypothetical protein ACREA0_30810 [bacterium]